MAVWDVSQNVDRFKAGLGIFPCISPDGCDFASNRHQALSGKQLLVLQGIPLDKLLLARETQKDCQDLAGNAMSTTVIGASLISAIICGRRSFSPNTSSASLSTVKVANKRIPPPKMTTQGMGQHILRPSEFSQLQLHDLKRGAILSARLCNCEGDKNTTRAAVQRCSTCGHTACVDCAGNPKHVYSIMHPEGSRSLTPIEFVSKWRHRLPARLRIDKFPGLQQFAPGQAKADKMINAFIAWIAEVNIGAQYFCLSDLSRHDRSWRAIYTSPQARLELRIGDDICWMLFITCASNLPGNNFLRKLLEVPIGRACVAESLLDAEWQLFFPSPQNCKLQMRGSVERSSSWRSRLGLPDHRSETVPKTIRIRSMSTATTTLEGEYDFLPLCGTACGSLYRRSTNPPLYMFLESDPIGRSDNDSFIFSHECGRKHFGDARISLARLDSSWRPWHLDSHSLGNVSITLPGSWLPAACQLKSICPTVNATVLSQKQGLRRSQQDCSQLLPVLTVQLPEKIPVRSFSDYSWTLGRAKSLPSFSTWQQIDTTCSGPCYCAPKYPRILWRVNAKGVATPHEDSKAAAMFERAIKTRQPTFQIQATSSSHDTEIQVGINILSLVHRARGRLAQLDTVSTAWRLITDHTEVHTKPFSRFHLQSNCEDAPYALSATLRYLRGAQPQSLSWMVAQELGKSITVAEVEEAVHSGLGWRVEACAQATLTIRGGVLADLPSFGKTVTTIALIQREFEQYVPDALLAQNETMSEKLPALINSAATLIVCPPHIALQWQTEIKKFLGIDTYNLYNIILVESFSQLRQLTIEKLQNSRIIIFSWTVFAEEEYISQLAQFAALPEPTTTNRRAFDVWFSRATNEIPSQLDVLRSEGFDKFMKSTSKLLKERLQHEEFQATLPTKIRHGSAYQPFSSMQTASCNVNGMKGRSKPHLKHIAKSSAGESHTVPLLHLFRFNRVVVDEYHYLNDEKKRGNTLASVSVKMVAAHKRWVLSGTPAVANFSDVDQIASYLGIKLGRHFLGDGIVTTQLEKTRKRDQTLVEDFLSQTEIMSRQWHQARHERAQEFLNIFVRQNEAELHHIACSEELLPIELEVAHHAIYLELSQHLVSQRMQIKKLNSKSSSDRTDRLNASLNNSATAEEALLRAALLFETSNGQSGLDVLIEKRSEQCEQTEEELGKLIAGIEGLNKDSELAELYQRFKKDVKDSNWLGDQESMQSVRRLLLTAETNPNSKVFPKLRALSTVKARQHTKKLLSQLRELSRELALRKRSERFIVSIRDIVQQSSDSAKDQTMTCSSPECDGTPYLSQICLIPHCGHSACEKCLSMRTDDESCVHPLCNLPVQMMNLIKASDLGSVGNHSVGRDFGRKLQAIARVIKKIPNDEQGIAFAPNEETTTILETLFNYYRISYHSPSLCKSGASAAMMEDFKSNKNHDKRKKMLILDLGTEFAAGV